MKTPLLALPAPSSARTRARAPKIKTLPHPAAISPGDHYQQLHLLKLKGARIDWTHLHENPVTALHVEVDRLPDRKQTPDDEDSVCAFGSIEIEHGPAGNRFEFRSICGTTRRNAIAVAKAIIKALQELPDEGVPVPADDAESRI